MPLEFHPRLFLPSSLPFSCSLSFSLFLSSQWNKLLAFCPQMLRNGLTGKGSLFKIRSQGRWLTAAGLDPTCSRVLNDKLVHWQSQLKFELVFASEATLVTSCSAFMGKRSCGTEVCLVKDSRYN